MLKAAALVKPFLKGQEKASSKGKPSGIKPGIEQPAEACLLLRTTGVVLTVMGISLVSVASLVWPQPRMAHDNSELGVWDGPSIELGGTVLGIALTLLSMLVLAGRLVAEELALRDSSLHPLQVLGYEGMWGTLLVGVSLPIVWKTPGDDVVRSGSH